MKTLVDVDPSLLKTAMELSRAPTKKETIRLALEELIRARRRQALKAMAGERRGGHGPFGAAPRAPPRAAVSRAGGDDVVLVDTSGWIAFLARRGYRELKATLGFVAR